MTIDEMIERKRELGYSNEKIARMSGVPLGTVQKIFGKITKSPRRETVVALEKALSRGKYEYSDARDMSLESLLNDFIPEYGGASRKREGFTVEDYYKLPDDRRVELIDGVFYDMASPSLAHQVIQGELFFIIKKYIAENDCECEAMLPVDTQLDRDDRTMVIPDLIIFCGMENVRSNKYYGAPDFIAEIISPSSRSRDMFTKLNKYKFAGVREYWIVDIKNRAVLVYDFEHDDLVKTYSFKDKIPLMISEGKCEVDFSRVDAAASPYYELETE